MAGGPTCRESPFKTIQDPSEEPSSCESRIPYHVSEFCFSSRLGVMDKFIILVDITDGYGKSGWWFGKFVIFIPICGNDPI